MNGINPTITGNRTTHNQHNKLLNLITRANKPNTATIYQLPQQVQVKKINPSESNLNSSTVQSLPAPNQTQNQERK